MRTPKSARSKAKAGRNQSSTGVQAVERALRIMEVLSEDAEGYRLTDLAVRTGLSPSTAHRLLTTLEDRRFVQCDRSTSLWHVGPQALAIGSTFIRRRNVVAAAMPTLRQLRDRTRETANLGIEDEGELVVLAQVESREMVRTVSSVGGRVHLTVDALGKAILATYPPEDVGFIIGRRGLTRLTDTSITRPGELERELFVIREVGYALDHGEAVPELRCAAASIRDPDGRALAAISVSGLASRLPEERLREFGVLVRGAADDLTRVMGGQRRDRTSVADAAP